MRIQEQLVSGAEGGSRTHMWGEPRRILSPLRLPVPPLRQFIKLLQNLLYWIPVSFSRHQRVLINPYYFVRITVYPIEIDIDRCPGADFFAQHKRNAET